MNFYEIITTRRTIRKFKQEPLKQEMLERFVDAARLAPNGGNQQPLKYMIINDPLLVQKVCEEVNWAIMITPMGIPKIEERPVAFILVLADTDIKKQGYQEDAGAAAENILLSAWSEGVGSCWMGAINRDNIRKIVKLDDSYVIVSAIALGYPLESPVIEEAKDSVKYYKDSEGVLHVPKRNLKEIIVESVK